MPGEQLRDQFLLDPDVTFLNHGAYGACPKPVFDEYQRWQRELERQPVEFLGRRNDDLLAEARSSLANYLGCETDSVVFITNATWGINLIIRSLDLEPGDEILTTDNEYGACTMSWEWLLAKSGAHLVRTAIPLPVESREAVVDSLWDAVTPHTRAIFISHITSPTALIFPVQEICRRAREAGILTIVDGAHAPGHIPLNLTELEVDIYAGNLHKWLCTPKGSGFLYVRPEEQGWVESLIISWGWGSEGILTPSSFVSRNQWQGTRDLAPFLSVPAAIAFQERHDWPVVRRRCHELARGARHGIAKLTGVMPICPDSAEWFAQMVACPVNTDDPLGLKTRLYDEFKIEVPIYAWQGMPLLRASFQGYNDERDLERLLSSLGDLLPARRAVPVTSDFAISDLPPAPSPAPAM